MGLSVAGVFAGNALDLVDAVREGDQEAVRSLLRESTDVDASQADGATALSWARLGFAPELRSFSTIRAFRLTQARERGVTP